ncbi:MAG: DotU family type IV/VI secretion system protein [Alphaproteobacteria bacterium]|nr:DotU family type IV/VI secretion system protein [Alphaproteobacteria bacterium]MBU0795776.1 DotU family type IV/VI secretion system protein [Alphaproteobacteria bacterium]MBU0887399.1 DotU family type IV/VI secretion system protein [Alphaproteobacteria bacterium]MBU1811720.1 DotU family type IV/VI secretion system protein [Alphaproteobacteria bacterium]MBU2091625.1 DotU family type IV/VI secretion system protein [Alphaproteobacteria bacterium]
MRNPAADMLLDHFRAFYDALEAGRGKALASAPAGWGEIQDSLVSLLDAQALAAHRQGGEVLAQAQQAASYPMAALADEIFVYLGWEDAAAWLDHLLEQRQFRSHLAGEEVFRRIDALDREGGLLRPVLARIYLLTLGLGFEGRYRDMTDGALALRRYRDRLYLIAFGRRPALDEPKARLTPEAYAHTAVPPPPIPSPGLAGWTGRLVMSLLVLFAVSALVWAMAVWPLLRALALLPV